MSRFWKDIVEKIGSAVDEKNSQLSKLCPGTRIVLQAVDPFPEGMLKNLLEKNKHTYLITNFPAEPNQNLTVIPLPTTFDGHMVDPEGFRCTDAVDRDFNCFLSRLDPVRQNIFYMIYQRDWLDRGYVSFNMDFRRSPGNQDQTAKQAFDQYHQQYLSSYDHLKSDIDAIVPFRNFDEHADIYDLTARSKFSIVAETFFERTDAKTFTEKTVRVLQTGRPFLLFAATGVVDRLRNYGFDVFDDIVDHSYNTLDTSVNAMPMLDLIIEQAGTLMNQSSTPALHSRLRQGFETNQKILADWHQNWWSDYAKLLDSTFDTAVDQQH